MNVTEAQIQAMGGVQYTPKYTWFLNKAPAPDSAFNTYVVEISRKYGVCFVGGLGKIIISSKDGAPVKAQFAKLKAELTAQYGASVDVNSLVPTSSLTGPNDWMESIYQVERELNSVWTAESKAPLPPGVSEIIVYADVLSDGEGYVNVYYRAKNWETCLEDAKQWRPKDS